jgi:hypothetical protein
MKSLFFVIEIKASKPIRIMQEEKVPLFAVTIAFVCWNKEMLSLPYHQKN